VSTTTETPELVQVVTDWRGEAAVLRRRGDAWTLTKVRRHALAFLHTPHVVMEKRVYRLRACIVPRRAHLEMIRAAAQQGAA